MRILAMLVLLLAYLPISQKAFAETLLMVSWESAESLPPQTNRKNIITEWDSVTNQYTEKASFYMKGFDSFYRGMWDAASSFQTDDALWLKDTTDGFWVYDIETSSVSHVGSGISGDYRSFAVSRVGSLVSSSGSGTLKIETETGDSRIGTEGAGTTSIGTNLDSSTATIITKGTATSTEISDGNGKTIIKRAADGSLHIGENSLVTKEENGKQSLSAQDANGDAIDINITNGSNLLINGKPVTAGVSIKEVRKYDSRSVALSAALTSLPTQSIDGSHACGIGSGVRGNYSAMALGCAADLDKIKLFDNAPLFIRNASINLGTSFLTHDDPDYTFKAGLTWNFGKSKANTRSLSKNDRRDIRSTIAEQKNALAINKLQKDNRVLKESNRELTRKLNSLIAANQRFLDLSEKMERLAQQIETQDGLLAIK